MLLARLCTAAAAAEALPLRWTLLRPFTSLRSLAACASPDAPEAAGFPQQRSTVHPSTRQLSTASGGDDAAGYTAPQRAEDKHAHGRTWTDPYSWMERGGADFGQHLAAEGRRARAALAPLDALRQQLLGEMMASLPTQQKPPPERVGAYEYWTEQTAESPRPVLLRRRLPDGRPMILLDANEDAAFDDGDLGTVKLSPSGGRIAFTVTTDAGSETGKAYVRELPVGCALVWDLADIDSVCSLEWLGEDTILFTVPDGNGRPHKVIRRKLSGAGSGRDEVVLQEATASRFLHLGRTKDGAFVTVNSNSKTSSEVHLMDPANPAASPVCVAPRREGIEYFVEHCRALSRPPGAAAREVQPVDAEASAAMLVLLTNHGSDSGEMRLMTATVGSKPSDWRLLHAPAPGVAITDVDVFSDAIALYERRSSRPAVSVLRFGTAGTEADEEDDDDLDIEDGAAGSRDVRPSPMRLETPDGFMCEPVASTFPTSGGGDVGDLLRVQLPSWATSVQPGLNAEPGALALRLRLSSPADPEHHVDFNLEDGVGRLVRKDELPADSQHAPAEYVSRRLDVTSADGTQVPMTLVHGENVPMDGSAPALLIAYGAYGECLDPDFQVSRLPLLARGWVLAFAHVRGGGELGRRWHDGGRGILKHKSVEDLEACLDHLVATGVSAPRRIAVEGTSAGGLLAAALVHRRGADLGAALLRAPFVDVVSTALRPEAPLVAHEASEWGDAANDATALDAMAALCPYHSLTQRAAPLRPPVLVTCAADDGRVPAWGPAKWVAALSAARQRQAEQAGEAATATQSSNQSAQSRLAAGQHQRQLDGGPRSGDTAAAAAAAPVGAPAPALLLPRPGGGHFGDERQHFAERALEYAFVVAACER